MQQDTPSALIADTLTHLKALLPAPQKAVPPKQTVPKTAPPPPPKAPPPPPKKEADFSIDLSAPSFPKKHASATCKLLQDLDPNLYLHDTVPSDRDAKRIKNAWKEKKDTPDIPILFQGKSYHSFLAQIAKAIDRVHRPCHLVEITPQKKWDLFLESPNLKLIIIPDALLFNTPELLPFYQENPQQKTRSLGSVPLLLLPDLSLYFKDPYLKRALWNVITTSITSAT